MPDHSDDFGRVFQQTLRSVLRYFHSFKIKLLLRMVTLFCVIVIAGFAGLMLFEYPHNEAFQSPWDVLYFIIVTLSTVGYGDYSPSTSGGRLVVVAIIISSLIFIALLSALTAAMFVESKLRQELGMSHFKFSKHIVIVGWNRKGPKIVELLRRKPQYQNRHIVVVAPLDKRPLDDAFVQLVHSATPVHLSDLRRAAAQDAETIILLANYEMRAGADAVSCVNSMVARKINPKGRIVAEILDPGSREYMEISGADRIIGVGEIGGILMAEACQDKNEALDMLESIA